MERYLSGDAPSVEEIEKALEDFGFYHGLVGATRIYSDHEKHGNLGYAGGVLEQPDEYWLDLDTMKWLELWVRYVKTMPRLPQESVFDQLREKGQFGSWLTGGGK